jgi:16S rRNA (cytosine967-C5)-methyltransferase
VTEALVAAIAARPRSAPTILSHGLRVRPELGPRDRQLVRLWVRAALRAWHAALHLDRGAAPQLAVALAAAHDAALAPWSDELPHQHLARRARLVTGTAARIELSSLPMAARLGVDAEWFVAPWAASMTEPFLAASLREPPLTVRLNRTLGSRSQLEAALIREQVRFDPVEGAPDALNLRTDRHVFDLASFRDGLFEVQDASGQRLCAALADHLAPGLGVLDLCAGRGGKSLALASLVPGLRLVATDIDAARLADVPARAARAGAVGVEVRAFEEALASRYDAVLVDAPCSGLGTLRRHPELRLWRTPGDIADLARTQHDVLRTAAARVGPGGLLVYATCSVLDAENEAIADAFTSASGEFEALDLVGDRAGHPVRGVRLGPDTHGTDGFFFAAWRRRA